MSTSLRTLKGVGEKTEKLFSKIGVTDVESLLSYYPRNYDAYEEPVEIKAVEESSVVAISGTVVTGVYVNQVRNLQVITTTVCFYYEGKNREKAGKAADGASGDFYSGGL